jgi:capsular polysaccharide biosynthesis protein
MLEEMRLQDYIRIILSKLWKNKFIISAFTLLFLLVGMLYATLQTIENVYYAQTTIYMASGITTQDTTVSSALLSGYSDIITSRKVCERAEAIVGNSEITADDIKKMISITSNKTSTILTITAYSDSGTDAVEVANALADAFVMEAQSMTNSTSIQVLDKALTSHIYNDGFQGMLYDIILFGLVGLALCVVVVVLNVLFTNRLTSVEQLADADEDDVIGIIPYVE